MVAGDEPTLISADSFSHGKARLDTRVSQANYIGSLTATLSPLVPELLCC